MRKNKSFSIGIIQQVPDIGGAETYMFALVKEFITSGHNIYLASNYLRYLHLYKDMGVNLYRIPVIIDFMGNYRGLVKSIFYLPYAIFYYFKLLSEFKKKEVDVILMSGFSEKLLVTVIAVFFALPVVWIEYGPLKTVFKRLMTVPKMLYILIKDIPEAIIVPSKNTQQSLVTDAGVSLKTLFVIACGTRIIKKQIDEKYIFIPQLRKNFVVGNISRLTIEKGQDILILAFSQVHKRMPNAKLLLVGDGPHKQFYEELVKQHKLEKHVLITGFVKDVTKYYDCMNLFVFPTIWELEGFGLVVTEAMSHRLPVIASRLGPVPEIVDDGKTGILVPPKDENTLARAIIKLAKDPVKRKVFGENGYKKFVEKYTIEKSSAQILAILYEAANR